MCVHVKRMLYVDGNRPRVPIMLFRSDMPGARFAGQAAFTWTTPATSRHLCVSDCLTDIPRVLIGHMPGIQMLHIRRAWLCSKYRKRGFDFRANAKVTRAHNRHTA